MSLPITVPTSPPRSGFLPRPSPRERHQKTQCPCPSPCQLLHQDLASFLDLLPESAIRKLNVLAHHRANFSTKIWLPSSTFSQRAPSENSMSLPITVPTSPPRSGFLPRPSPRERHQKTQCP